MTFHVLTRIVITSLILLGDSAIASEINNRCDAEAVISGNSVQASHPESSNDTDSKWQSVLAGASFIQNVAVHRFQTLTTVYCTSTPSFSYGLYHSRAPPVSL